MKWLVLIGGAVAAVGLFMLATASADTTIFARHYPLLLGLNAARVYGVDPVRRTYAFTRRDLEEIRKALPFKHETYGPRNAGEVRRLRDAHRGWPG